MFGKAQVNDFQQFLTRATVGAALCVIIILLLVPVFAMIAPRIGIGMTAVFIFSAVSAMLLQTGQTFGLFVFDLNKALEYVSNPRKRGREHSRSLILLAFAPVAMLSASAFVSAADAATGLPSFMALFILVFLSLCFLRLVSEKDTVASAAMEGVHLFGIMLIPLIVIGAAASAPAADPASSGYETPAETVHGD